MNLDREKLRELFDLGGAAFARSGGAYEEDPYPGLHRLREAAPVHEGIVHELLGFEGPAMFQGLPYPERPHFSAFSFEACDAAFRDEETFASSPTGIQAQDGTLNASMLMMGGQQHRRYRALVQPSFVPSRGQWWSERFIVPTVNALIDSFEADGRADLNFDFCAPIPVLTITGSFGLPLEAALDLRSVLHMEEGFIEKFRSIVAPRLAERRESPQDDLLSVLAQAELTDEDGEVHRLTDAEILSFSHLLLAAGSGTTWKQMGIALTALLNNPDILDAVRRDRSLLRAAIDESVRWAPTDPMFSRFVMRDIEFFGAKIPAGSVLHLSLGCANRDPARWEDPDAYDPTRTPRPHLGFGAGPHVCLGMHVARAEMATGIGALLDRLPNLRADPDRPPPRVIGMYERGPRTIPVVF